MASEVLAHEIEPGPLDLPRAPQRSNADANAYAYAQQVAAAPAPAAAPMSAVEQLQALADLRNERVVTDAEFDAEKAKIVAS